MTATTLYYCHWFCCWGSFAWNYIKTICSMVLPFFLSLFSFSLLSNCKMPENRTAQHRERGNTETEVTRMKFSIQLILSQMSAQLYYQLQTVVVVMLYTTKQMDMDPFWNGKLRDGKIDRYPLSHASVHSLLCERNLFWFASMGLWLHAKVNDDDSVEWKSDTTRHLVIDFLCEIFWLSWPIELLWGHQWGWR